MATPQKMSSVSTFKDPLRKCEYNADFKGYSMLTKYGKRNLKATFDVNIWDTDPYRYILTLSPSFTPPLVFFHILGYMIGDSFLKSLTPNMLTKISDIEREVDFPCNLVFGDPRPGKDGGMWSNLQLILPSNEVQIPEWAVTKLAFANDKIDMGTTAIEAKAIIENVIEKETEETCAFTGETIVKKVKVTEPIGKRSEPLGGLPF